MRWFNLGAFTTADTHWFPFTDQLAHGGTNFSGWVQLFQKNTFRGGTNILWGSKLNVTVLMLIKKMECHKKWCSVSGHNIILSPGRRRDRLVQCESRMKDNLRQNQKYGMMITVWLSHDSTQCQLSTFNITLIHVISVGHSHFSRKCHVMHC